MLWDRLRLAKCQDSRQVRISSGNPGITLGSTGGTQLSSCWWRRSCVCLGILVHADGASGVLTLNTPRSYGAYEGHELEDCTLVLQLFAYALICGALAYPVFQVHAQNSAGRIIAFCSEKYWLSLP